MDVDEMRCRALDFAVQYARAGELGSAETVQIADQFYVFLYGGKA